MKVFCAGLGTETNTFSPLPTGLASFKTSEYYPAGTHPETPSVSGSPYYAALQRAKRLDWQVIQGLMTSAPPSGITTRLAYETLRDELLSDLRGALPVDMVLLSLHGAMVADGYDDCEGDLIVRARALVGDAVVIGVELDPHAHLSSTIVEHASQVILYKEYPHTDILETAEQLVDLCYAQYLGHIQPTPALVDTQMIVPIHTTRDPGRSLVQHIKSLEGKNGVISISIAQGFATGDVPDMGTKVLVYCDNNLDQANKLAQTLVQHLINIRETLLVPYRSIQQALDEALAHHEGPVVLADRPDNPGSGAPGDSTFLLQAIIDRKVKNVAVGPFWDPMAVATCFDAGVGAHLSLRIGGKAGPLSGHPIDFKVNVLALAPKMMMTGLTGTPVPLGDCALIEADGVSVVLTTERNQAMNTDLFTQLGCDLHTKNIIVVKSAQHFYASFSEVASQVIYVGGQGVATPDWHTLPYQKIALPKWPISES